LRILHLSDTGLPDWRIEKSAISAANRGHEVFFGGLDDGVGKVKTIFAKIYRIGWSPRARRGFPLYWPCIKKQIGQVLRQARPDIVHAHNIFSAKMMSEFDIPFVYDDHEYWPGYVRRQAETTPQNMAGVETHLVGGLPRRIVRKIARGYLMTRAINSWSKWEEDIVSAQPTITVSEKIAKELRDYSNNNSIFVTPNFPTKWEIRDFQEPKFHDSPVSVYAGLESKTTLAHRNIYGLADVFCSHNVGSLVMIGIDGESSSSVKYTGFLPRKEMFFEMQKASIGLLPFRRHWSHFFINPNKVYEYAHAGLFVMCTSSFTTVAETFKGKCALFDDYDDMVEQFEYFKNNLDELYRKRLQSFEFARENLLWEKYEGNIFQAYQAC
jgi:glycosyltransferase involved in cell wall biosynthesis